MWAVGMGMGGITGFAMNQARDLGPTRCCPSRTRLTTTGSTASPFQASRHLWARRWPRSSCTGSSASSRSQNIARTASRPAPSGCRPFSLPWPSLPSPLLPHSPISRSLSVSENRADCDLRKRHVRISTTAKERLGGWMGEAPAASSVASPQGIGPSRQKLLREIP